MARKRRRKRGRSTGGLSRRALLAALGLGGISTASAYETGAFDTVEVAYLDGRDTPFLDEMEGFSVDGATFKVRMDAGVAPLSYRTMVKLPG